MTDKIDRGGYAFPGDSSHLLGSERGMTMRDFFAAKAMQSLLTCEGEANAKSVAKAAYFMADAMLRARESA